MHREHYELPPDRIDAQRRAIRLEWITLGLMATVIAAVGLTMGASQTMKAAWVEDMLSLVPPAAFLISNRVAKRPPDREYPFGRYRAVSIAFLAGAVALTIFGLFILLDSVLGLLRAERPSIGTMTLFGRTVWAGWLMIAALSYGLVIPLVLGRLKLPLAREIHDKTLKADADMNRADWLTGAAGIAGVLGVGFGWWWADSAAGGIIALSIVKDGFENLSRVVRDLMDRRPTSVEGDVLDLPDRLRDRLAALPWVREARVRLREEGHVLTELRGDGDHACGE